MFEYKRLNVFDYATTLWDEQAARARESGKKFAADVAPYAKGRGVDVDANLCAVQAEQAAKGVVWATFFKNVYGWCVRDTNNNGGGRMSPNFKTVPEAIAWAAQWHAKDPEKRRVDYVFGRIEDENREFAAGLVTYYRLSGLLPEEAPQGGTMLWKIVKGNPTQNRAPEFVRYFSGTRGEALELVKPTPNLFPVLCGVDETRLYYTQRRLDTLYQMVGAIEAAVKDLPIAKRVNEIFHTYEVEADRFRKAESADVIGRLTDKGEAK
jgi:hypothetical protein